MATFMRATQPTGYSDDDGWISKAEWIARFCLPELKPAQRKVFDMMLDGYIFHTDGRTRKMSLRRGDEIVPVRAWLPAELLEAHGERKERGPADRFGYRKVYTSTMERLNGAAKAAVEHE